MLQSGHTYAIINKKSGTAFDLSDTDHTSIVGYDFHGGDNQKVRLTTTPSISRLFF